MYASHHGSVIAPEPAMVSEPLAAFDGFFRENYRPLIRRVMAAGATWTQATDAADESMKEVLRRPFEIDNHCTYVRAAVLSTFLRAKRRDSRRGSSSTQHGPNVWEDGDCVRRLLAMLSPVQRAEFSAILNGYGSVDAAAVLGDSPAAVRENLVRARRRLIADPSVKARRQRTVPQPRTSSPRTRAASAGRPMQDELARLGTLLSEVLILVDEALDARLTSAAVDARLKRLRQRVLSDGRSPARATDETKVEAPTLWGDDPDLSCAPIVDMNPVLTDGNGYRGATAIAAAAISYRQLDYWARTGLVIPSVRDCSGSGTQRLYSFRDIVVLRLVKRLLDAGVSLPNVRKAIETSRQWSENDLVTLTLISDGDTVYECRSDEEIIDLVRGGQAVFGIAIAGAFKEIQGSLAALSAESPTADGRRESGVADGPRVLDELAARRARRRTSVRGVS